MYTYCNHVVPDQGRATGAAMGAAMAVIHFLPLVEGTENTKIYMTTDFIPGMYIHDVVTIILVNSITSEVMST